MLLPHQPRAHAFLARLLAGGRVPHALLLVGNTGWGTLQLALHFAAALQCERTALADDAPAVPALFGDAEPPATPPCGSCSACRKSAQFIHPDIHFSFPTVGTNAVSTDFAKQWRAAMTENPYQDVNAWLHRIGADNKQGNINKEECQAIAKKLSLKAFEGRRKILVMWLPEYLGKEGNRLLKLIEEPPEQTQFLLVAENTDAILPTILSRCQLVKTDPLPDSAIIEGLARHRNLSADRAQPIAFLADGDLNLALQIADNPVDDDARLLLDWLRKCWKGYGPELVQWTEAFAKLGRENQKQFLHYGLHFLRELNTFVADGRRELRLRAEELQAAYNMGRLLSFEQIAAIATIFSDNIYYIERNANPKILFLDTSIRLHQILKNKN
jgi:DNA polymerase III subunit delta'